MISQIQSGDICVIFGEIMIYKNKIDAKTQIKIFMKRFKKFDHLSIQILLNFKSNSILSEVIDQQNALMH